uniref:C3H1-type domain-containing protein n=1 Tax=Oryza meridionalis TaxID=40149 RepID=A0A0E0CZD2_9ORYZ
MEGELSLVSPARSSCFSFEDGGSGSPTWVSTVEALLRSPTSSVSDGGGGGGGGGYNSPARASSPLQKQLPDCRDAGDLSSLTWASTLEKPLESPSSCISDGRGGGFGSPTSAFPPEKLLISPPTCVSDNRGVGNVGGFPSLPWASSLEKLLTSPSSCVSDSRGVGNSGGFPSLPWASSLEKPLTSPSSCVSDGRSGGYSSPLGASAEREHEVREAEMLLRAIAERYDDCFLRLRDAAAELSDLRRERLRLAAENLHLSLLLEELESEQRKQASAMAPPKPEEDEAAQGGAPKSISIRSPGYLSQKQPQGQARPQRLRVCASRAMEISHPNCLIFVMGNQCSPQEAAAAGDEEDEEDKGGGEVEVEAYRQGAAKTELCNKWERGACPYGARCRFAHGLQELRPVIRHPRYKTLPCQMFAAASGCPYGHRCHFRHSPLRAAAESFCY